VVPRGEGKTQRFRHQIKVGDILRRKEKRGSSYIGEGESGGKGKKRGGGVCRGRLNVGTRQWGGEKVRTGEGEEVRGISRGKKKTH